MSAFLGNTPNMSTYSGTGGSRKHDESDEDWDRHKKSKSDRHDRKKDKSDRKRDRSESGSEDRRSG